MSAEPMSACRGCMLGHVTLAGASSRDRPARTGNQALAGSWRLRVVSPARLGCRQQQAGAAPSAVAALPCGLSLERTGRLPASSAAAPQGLLVTERTLSRPTCALRRQSVVSRSPMQDGSIKSAAVAFERCFVLG